MREARPSLSRLAASVAIASAIVFALLVGGLWAFGAYDGVDGQPRSQRVALLSDSERIDLAALLGEDTGPQRPRLPDLDDIPPLVLPKPAQSGFVQVELVVDGQGRVAEAEVVGSTHEGLFEQQALAIVKSRRYVPRPDGGLDRRTEIVDFTIADDGVERD